MYFFCCVFFLGIVVSTILSFGLAIGNEYNMFCMSVCQETVWEAFKIFWDRIPTQIEYQSWLSQCQAGTVTIHDVGSSFSKSEEHLQLVLKVCSTRPYIVNICDNYVTRLCGLNTLVWTYKMCDWLWFISLCRYFLRPDWKGTSNTWTPNPFISHTCTFHILYIGWSVLALSICLLLFSSQWNTFNVIMQSWRFFPKSK